MKGLKTLRSKTTRAADAQEPAGGLAEALELDEPAEALELDAPASEGLEQVRSLLFGAELLEIRQQIAGLETGFSKEISKLSEQIDRRLEGFERNVRQQLVSLDRRVNSERQDRADNVDDVIKKLKDLGQDLEKKLDEVREMAGKGQSDLREQLVSQSSLLTDLIHQYHDDATRLVSDNVQELRAMKVDRATFSGLLMETATRLTRDEEVAGEE